MAQKIKPTAQERSFAMRMRHYAELQQAIDNYRRDNAFAAQAVRALLRAAVRARAEQ